VDLLILILPLSISYFSDVRGWACDNVRQFEVVTSSGSIVLASPTENTDLFWALRGGGGSNFGIVTRFDLVSFDQTDLWTNTLIFPGAVTPSVLNLFTDLTVTGLPTDPGAHTYFALTYMSALGGYAGITSFYHATVPSPADSIPAIFKPFQSLPAIVNTTAVANVTTLSLGISEPYRLRTTWWDTTVAATSAQLLVDIVSIFEGFVSKLNATASVDGQPAITPFLVFQPISVNILQQMQKNGGNALGLTPEDGPLFIVQISSRWSNRDYDCLVETESRKSIAKIESIAKERGLFNEFKYMNYAGKSQPVFPGYGEASERRLKEVALKYDPDQLLQKLWKGYFQLGA
jgi:hypothetical protein